MSDINQVDNNSEHCDSPSISALEFNPSAINVSEEIENLLADESISESENENKYANNKKDISELFQNSYMHMDEEFQKYLENFNESVKHNEYQKFILKAINEQISNFAQTYPTNLKASSNEALLFMRRYRFANCSCFSCCFKDAYPSSNVQ